MRIFVAYGFNDRDRWIPELVIPILKSLGAEVVTGEQLEGQVITAGVRARINESDALIGFLTRRGEADAEGVYRTHDWVKQELGAAVGRDLPYVLEVRETGIDAQGGMLADRQYVTYDESRRDRFLVRLVEVISSWSRGVNVNLRVLPDDVAMELAPHVRRTYKCWYTVLEDGRESAPRPAHVYQGPGGLTIAATGIPPRALISVRVEAAGAVWLSPYFNVDARDVTLTKDA